jgi:3-oxoadipate enol-lactonase
MTARNFPLIHFELDDFTEPWRETPAPVVVLHPGLGGNSRLYRAWVPFLSDAYRVVRVTARGQAGTPRPDGFERSLDNFVRDVIDVMDHLGVERFHWAGASGGGVMGQYAGIAFPDRIASLSLIATTARFRGPTPNYDDWLKPLYDGDQRLFMARDSERRFGTDNPARANWILDELARTGAAESLAMHKWVHTVSLIDDLHKIKCPALIVTGEHDTLTDLNDAQIMADRIPNSRVEILRDRPHNIAYTHPKETATVVRRFLDQVEAGEA